MSYPCPHCRLPIIAATQPNFDDLPPHLRKRRHFDAAHVAGGQWVITVHKRRTENGIEYTAFYYRERRPQDDKTKLRSEHQCEKKR